MPTALYLVAPLAGDGQSVENLLRPVLAAARIEALLLPRGMREEADYRALAKAVVRLAQDAGAAVLLEGTPALVHETGADGLHLDGSVADIRTAIAALRPQRIVGAAVSEPSRHEAMVKGELEVDYIMFGPLSGPIDDKMRELARWWAETMEVPSVLSDPEARPDTAESEGCEFLAIGESLWRAPEGAAEVVLAFARRLAGERTG